MRVDIAVQCHLYERRLCWMLSSALDSGVNLGFIISYVKGTGRPSVPEVAEVFGNRIRLELISYPDISEYQYRGWVRNRQLERSSADWIVFADSDMVYPPGFFSRMKLLLEGPFRNDPRCLYSARFSTTLKETNELVNSFEYPCVIADAYSLASRLPGALRPNIGAGYFQLVNTKLLRRRSDPWYSPPGVKIDYSWERFSKCRSDKQFRRRLGSAPIDLPVQIHLQHERDGEAGRHLSIQR